MVRLRWLVLCGLFVYSAPPALKAQQEPSSTTSSAVRLQELLGEGTATRVLLEQTAEGKLQPAAAPNAPAPSSMPVKVESRLDYDERILELGAAGTPQKAIRYVHQAAAAINSRARPMLNQLRPEVATLVAYLKNGSPVVYGLGGPLTRSELDLVQGLADPLVLSGLLPEKAVSVGDTWTIGEELARSLSEYEALAANSLRVRLEALDEATARIQLAGQVRGAIRGGEGTLTLEGTVSFDRESKLISSIDLRRSEVRTPGHVEAGLDLKGTLKLTRQLISVPPELSDKVLESVSIEPQPALELLRFSPPDGKYVIYHDRDWHLVWDDRSLCVLKRLDNGEIRAQCNLSMAPKVEPGRHQEIEQLRGDIRQALGKRFVAFVGAGEVSEPDSPEFRYKIAAQGREADHDILWYYFLVASSQGDQLLAAFTLNLADKDRFGDQDLQVVGSLQWVTEPRTTDSKAINP